MEPGLVLDQRYQLVEVLGRGGMGTVWGAADLKLNRPVAVKIVLDHRDPELVHRMGREAIAAGRLSHPHIATVHDFGQTAHEGTTVTYIVMELVDGRPLTRVLAEGEPDLSLSLGWAQQIALALAAAHAPEVGVIHRDLKPDNVLITRDDLVKIVDFGIARFIGDRQSWLTRLTKPGALLGTPAYMAPEQCLSGPLDGRTDLYALGCVLYEMVTGDPPFADGSPLAVAVAQVHDTPTAPRHHNPAVPAELDLLILELLAKDPGGRPADATTVHRRLAAISAARYRAPVDAPAVPAEPLDVPARQRLAPVPGASDHDPGPEELLRLSGDIHPAQGHEPAEALRLWCEAATRLIQELGPRHPRTLTARRALAWHTGAAGQHTKAAALWEDIVPDLQLVHGHFHRVTYGAQRLQAWNAGMAGRPADAVRLLTETIPDATRLLGRSHPDILEARRFLAWNIGELGRHRKAARLLRKLTTDLAQALGPGHEHTLEARYMLAWNTEKSGDHITAIRLLRELMPDIARALGRGHEQWTEVRRLLDRYTG